MGAVRKASSLISWKSTGRLQQTLAGCVERTGITLHSGRITKVRLCPHIAGEGRCFDVRRSLIPASIDYVEESPLCTTLSKDGVRIRTVEHLLSALEAYGVDNCRIEVEDVGGGDVRDFEVPIFDGSAKEWVEAIEEVGLEHARDDCGNNCETMAPYLCEPVHVSRDGSSFLAFPSSHLHVNCGINFPQAASIGCQWFTSSVLDYSFYQMQIAPARTFCIFEEIEKMLQSGLIKGGSLENALICSSKDGWLNPPLRFDNEPARHKALDLIGDLSLLARFGSQGLPVAHLVAYKIVEYKCLVVVEKNIVAYNYIWMQFHNTEQCCWKMFVRPLKRTFEYESCRTSNVVFQKPKLTSNLLIITHIRLMQLFASRWGLCSLVNCKSHDGDCSQCQEGYPWHRKDATDVHEDLDTNNLVDR